MMKQNFTCVLFITVHHQQIKSRLLLRWPYSRLNNMMHTQDFLLIIIFTLKCNVFLAVLRIFKPQHVLNHLYVDICYCACVSCALLFGAPFQCRCCSAGDAQSASFPLPFSVMRFCDMSPTATP